VSPSPWHLDRHLAQLRIGPLSVDLDLLCLAAGLKNWHGLGQASTAIHILAVEAPMFPAGEREKGDGPHLCEAPSGPFRQMGTVPFFPLVEAYLRGPDLIAVYRESSDWPVTLHGQWTALTPEAPAQVLAAVELTLSVRTERLDARPELCVCGGLPAGDVFELSDPDSARFDPCEPRDAPHSATSAEGPSCVLVRPHAGKWSYAEMVHPAATRAPSGGWSRSVPGGSELTPAGAADGQVVLRHRLFERRLEKGVLLRTRIRGVFLPPENDALVAAAQYRAFACADPPLGT
jgi:hypothetical protein